MASEAFRSMRCCIASVLCPNAGLGVLFSACVCTQLVIPKGNSNPEHNAVITTLSITKFTSEPDIVDQAMSHCPWLNIGDQSTFTRGSMNFETLSLVTLVICPLYPKIIPNTTTSVQNQHSVMRLRKEIA